MRSKIIDDNCIRMQNTLLMIFNLQTLSKQSITEPLIAFSTVLESEMAVASPVRPPSHIIVLIIILYYWPEQGSIWNIYWHHYYVILYLWIDSNTLLHERLKMKRFRLSCDLNNMIMIVMHGTCVMLICRQILKY